MKKQSPLFVLIAVFSAALIFSGCPTGGSTEDPGPDTDTGNSGGGGGGGGGFIGGGGGDGGKSTYDVIAFEISAKTLQDYVDDGYDIVFKGNPSARYVTGPITITNAEGIPKLDLKTAVITIASGVTVTRDTNALIIVASKAKITGAAGALKLHGSDVFIKGSGVAEEVVTGVSPVEAKTEIPSDLTSGDTVSVATASASDLEKIPSGATVYITEKLTLSGSGDLSSVVGNVTVSGELEITAGSVDLSSNFTLQGTALTTGTATTAVTLPDNVLLSALETKGDLTLTGDAVTVTGTASFAGETTIDADLTLQGAAEFKAGGEVTANKTLAIAEGAALTISGEAAADPETGATLTVAATGTITIGENAKVQVAETGTLDVAGIFNTDEGAEIEISGTYILEGNGDGSVREAGTNNGTVYIKSGGVTHGKGGAVDGEGLNVVEKGGKALYTDTQNAQSTTKIMIDGTDDPDSAAIFQLLSGTLSFNNWDYILDGTGKLANNFQLYSFRHQKLTVESNSTLTIASNVVLNGQVGNNSPDNSTTQIVNSGTITLEIGGTSNFYDSSGSGAAPIAGTYAWNATADGSSNAGWKATN